MKRSVKVLCCALALLLVLGAAHAQAARVAIAAAASASFPSDPRYTDPQTLIMGTGLFTAVDLINVTTSTPTLAELQQYDAVMTWSNVNYANAAAFGDVLADYVDAGGGVVVAVYANSTTNTSRYLGGRWITGGYEVIPSAGGTTSGASNLGSVLVPNHPIMQGVNAHSASSAARPTTTALAFGATKIAEWADGKTFVAVGANSHRVDLGFYPPSSNVTSTYWNPATSDGARLMANALLYSIPEPATISLLGVGLLLALRRR